MAFETMTERANRRWGPRLLSLSLEGLAVLAGVLLAFAVDSYGQTRDDRQRAARMLTALDSELEVNAGRLDGLIESADRSLNEIDSIFAAVILPPAGIVPSAEDVTEAIRVNGPIVNVPYQTGALDDLLLSGGLALVEDQHVRQTILEYSRLLSREAAAQDNAVSFWNEHMSPYLFEYSDISRFLVADRLGLSAPPPALEAFVRSRHFANILGERRAIVNRLRSARRNLRTQIDSVRPLLR
jgi:hypothetical protein